MSLASNRALIRAMLRSRGTSLAKLARENGLSRAAMTQALVMPGKKAEKLISDALGVPPYRLWPDRYTRKGTRLVGKRSRSARKLMPRPMESHENVGGTGDSDER